MYVSQEIILQSGAKNGPNQYICPKLNIEMKSTHAEIKYLQTYGPPKSRTLVVASPYKKELGIADLVATVLK